GLRLPFIKTVILLRPIRNLCRFTPESRHLQCTSRSALGPIADISAGELAGNPTRGCPQGSHVVRQSRAVARVCWMTFLSLLVNCVGPGSIVNLLSVPVKRKGGW